MPAMPRIDPPRLVQFAAVLAILAGLLFWGYLLLAPIPGVVQAEVADVPPPSGEDAAQRWFAAPSGEVEVQLAGLISGGPAAIAILSVNGAPAQAYREGEVLGTCGEGAADRGRRGAHRAERRGSPGGHAAARRTAAAGYPQARLRSPGAAQQGVQARQRHRLFALRAHTDFHPQ